VTRKKVKSDKEKRISIKVSESLYEVISKEIKKHPEWGMSSVSEFIRRAIDHELQARKSTDNRKIIEIVMNEEASREGTRRRGS